MAARRWACARLIGSAVVIAGCLGESRTTVRLRDERSCLPRCHPHSAMPHSRDRRDGRAGSNPAVADRRCPVSLALCAGAYWRPRPAPPRVRSGGSRVHSLSSSLRLAPTAGSLDRRATGTRPVHSPLIRDVRGVWAAARGRVKRGRATSGGRRPVGAFFSGRGIVVDVPLETVALQHRQHRVARVARVGCRPPAQPEDRATPRHDATGIPARSAQARRQAGARGPRIVVDRHQSMAERVGFEPTKSFDSALFKSAAINRSATSPAREDTSDRGFIGEAGRVYPRMDAPHRSASKGICP